LLNKSLLVVWDSKEKMPTVYSDVAFWQSYNLIDNHTNISIPKLVEEDSDALRSSYLSLIYDLGETKINNKRVIDILEIFSGFSYWWMSLLVEKCNFAKSPQVNNVIKLIAFKHWLNNKRYKHIQLVSSNVELATAMQLLCTELSVAFKWEQLENKIDKISITRQIYNKLPHKLRPILWLVRYLFFRWPLKGVGLDEWRKTPSKTTFVSYLFNLVPNALEKGKFESRYWTSLPNLLKHSTTNWLHLYVSSPELPNARTARNTIRKFNKNYDGIQVHTTLDSFLSIERIYVVLKHYYKLIKKQKLLHSSLESSAGIYWPLLAEDYKDSMSGDAAISNLLNLSLFESAMNTLPSQENGVYLQENQGWEFALTHYWHLNHGNKLIGWAHSTTKFWDLRYYFDPRVFNSNDDLNIPLPDYFAVNSKTTKAAFIDAGYQTHKIKEVEALRYLHFRNNRQLNSNKKTSKKSILILGDYLRKNTDMLMSLIDQAEGLINRKNNFIVKPHPACSIDSDDYPELDLYVTNNEIQSLLGQCVLAISSSTTSAAIDCYCMGTPIVTVLNPESLNLSPLRGNEDVVFVSSAEELSRALIDNDKIENSDRQDKDYFYSDPKLIKWKKLLFSGNNQV
jgi:surface carbohydrate biosynthesis protein (TIGR04326 family)